MSNDDWWNSTPTADDAVGALPRNAEPTNALPENTAETIPLQPRTRSTLGPNNPMPTSLNLAPTTNQPQPSSRSPSPYGGHPSPEETADTIPLQPRTRSTLSPNNPKPAPADLTPRINDPKPATADLTPKTNDSKPAPADLTPRINDPKPATADPTPKTNDPKPAPADLNPKSNHLHPSRSPSPYGRHPIPDLHPLGSNGGHDPFSGHHGPGHESGPEDRHGYGAVGGGPFNPDTPEWSIYHHDHTHKKVDRNTLKRNMTIAKGFLDISLLSANSNQLRNLLNFGDRNENRFYVTMAALFVSLALQVVTGVLLILVERWNINKPHHQQSALRLNNAVTVLVFLTLVINCLVSSMGVDIRQHDLISQEDLLIREMPPEVNDPLDAELVPSG